MQRRADTHTLFKSPFGTVSRSSLVADRLSRTLYTPPGKGDDYLELAGLSK
jgi:hypothetical protein